MNAASSPTSGQASHRLALPPGFDLDGCRIESVLGKGGFGLTYLATDTTLNFKVAIKELLPDGIATRVQGATVVAQTEELGEAWEWALRRFEEEARTLAQLRHPNIVRVLRLIRAHGTVYMVMEYVEGMSFAQWLDQNPRPGEAVLRGFLTPILEGLEHVHQKRLLHRDISPENIFIARDGRPVLLDFGSARQDLGKTMSVTAVVRHGYSPFEQYQVKSHQGAYTDLYALAGVMATAMTGRKPPPATDRISNDSLFPPLITQTSGRYSEIFCQAIDRAFAVRPQDRPQSIPAFLQLLSGAMPPALPGHTVPPSLPPNVPRSLTPLPLPSPGVPYAKPSPAGWITAGAIAVLCGGLAAWWFGMEAPARYGKNTEKLEAQATEINVLTQQLADSKSDAGRHIKAKTDAEARAQAAEARKAELERQLASARQNSGRGGNGNSGTGSNNNNYLPIVTAFGASSAQALFNTFGAIAELYELHSNRIYDSARTVQLATDYKRLLTNIHKPLSEAAASGALQPGDVAFVNKYIAINEKLAALAQHVMDIAQSPSQQKAAAYEQTRKECWAAISEMLGIKD